MAGAPVKLCAGDTFDMDTMLLMFTHIPKSGGTSFHAAMQKMLEDGYKHCPPEVATKTDLSALSGLGGHINFEPEFVRGLNKNRVYVSFLRDPVDRFFSFYHHVIKRPGHHLPQKMPGLLKMPPLQFARALMKIKNTEVSNMQCRMLTGSADCSGDMAIEHVQTNYTLCVDFSEQQTAIDQIAALLGKPTVSEQRLNRSAAKVPAARDPETVAYIEQINEQDMKLYRAICGTQALQNIAS